MSTYKARKEAATKSKFSHIKLLTTSALTAAGLIASGTAMAQNVAPDALPQGAVVTTGSADYDYSDARLDITQNNRGITSARYEGGFNIGNAATVNVNQVEGDTFVHVDTSGDTSFIEGVFEGDAGNIVLNRNGVLITGSARIDMNSFAASTAESVSFDGDNVTFDNLGDASVEIQSGAQITIAEGGVAAFVAPNVANAGVINAKLGKVAFAAGEKVTVDLYGDGLFEVEVEGELADAYLENTGAINANGGTVQMTALAVKDVADNIINLDGVVDVSSVTQTGGKIVLSGGDNGTVAVKAKIDATGATKGGSFEATGEKFVAIKTAQINTSSDAESGTIAVTSDSFDLEGGLDAGDGQVTLSRLTEGQLDIGDANGSTYNVSQDELGRITAGTLQIGDNEKTKDNNIRVDNANFTRFDQTEINTAVNDSSNQQEIRFQGDNFANALTVNADDDVRMGNNSSLETFGNVVLDGGEFSIRQSSTIDTNGNDITINTGDVDMRGGSLIDAEGGNIAINNSGLFESEGADTLRTNGTGTIALNQNGGTAAGASIQNAIDAIDNTGTSQSRIFTDSSTYNENLTIDQANLKIEGDNTEIIGNGTDAVITVLAENFTLDPVIVDAAGADFGIIADGIGAIGFTSGGNTFRNSDIAGIFVAANGVGTGTIENNIFEGSATRGVQTGILQNGYTLNITDNTIGSVGDEVETGLDFGVTINADINVERGTINATGDAVKFRNGLSGGTSTVTLTDVVATGGDEALDVDGVLGADSTLIVDGGTFTGADNGAEFQPINGTVTITDATLVGTTRRGLNLREPITGDLTITGGSITGETDGIGSDVAANTIDGGKVVIEGVDITGTTGNGVVFAGLSNGATLDVIDNTITATNDGIEIEEDITNNAALTITSNTIDAGGDGIDIDNVRNNAIVTIGGAGLGNTIDAGSDGIEFDAGIDSTVTIQENQISADNDGIAIFDGDAGHVTGVSGGATVSILDNKIGSEAGDSIGSDGIDFDDSITGNSTVTISGNTIGQDGNAVGDNGIEFDGIEGGATVNITDNQGIYADDHGIYVGDAVTSGAEVNIHDNTIAANEDQNHVGSGIFFDGTITDADVNIGDGAFGNFVGGASNIISVRENTSNGFGQSDLNGIHFDKEIGQLAQISIDGNRIGYRPNLSRDPIANDGIRFDGDITADADIEITDNFIRANDEGIQFLGEVGDTASILIGGANDDNFIRAENGSGIAFGGDITDEALVEIAYADIEAGEDGIVFSGDTSTAKTTGGTSDNEIYIHNSDITGDDNGINFEGRASDNRHDIKIENNDIRGLGERGIVHSGGIDNARLDIINNDSIRGRTDGVQVTGFLFNDADVNITGNENVSGDIGDGIEVTDSGFTFGSDVNINGNEITSAGDNAIEVENVDDVEIRDNIVAVAGDDGINVDNSDRAQITGNNIQATSDNGIFLDGSETALINNNDVSFAGDDGIQLVDSSSSTITNNRINIVGDDGIDTTNSILLDINDNVISNTSGDGIEVNSGFGIDILRNTITAAGGDGIEVTDVFGIDITDNNIVSAGDDGIDVDISNFVNVINNSVNFTGANGVEVENSEDVNIENNFAGSAGENGVFVAGSDRIVINNNIVSTSSLDGIQVAGSEDADVTNNFVVLAGANGINIDTNTGDNTVINNVVTNAGANGISVDTTDGVIVNENTVENATENGIFIADSNTDISVEENVITGSLISGIELDNVDGVNILQNDITDSGVFGLLASGPTNGDVTLVGNTFTDNPTGASFESGNIDLSDLATPNSFINTDAAGTPVGLQFDEVGIPGSLTIEGNTLGGTVLTGFNNAGSFYARIENGTLLDTGTGAPIVIDAQNVNFDGFVPSSVGGILSAAELTFLEDRLFDADDLALNGRGQIFVGAVPALNFEDFLREFGFGNFGASGLNLRIASLPAVDGASLAAIQPAAGGETGQGAEDLASIEPAAGEEGETTACIGDAIASAGNGVAANFSFGGTFEESLADASACQSGIQ